MASNKLYEAIDESWINKKICIKRSSGTDQMVFISKIDQNLGLITVEWEEGGVAKAKEISFRQLYDWNEGLFNKKMEVSEPANMPARNYRMRRTAVFNNSNNVDKVNNAKTKQVVMDIDFDCSETKENDPIPVAPLSKANVPNTNSPNYEFFKMINDYMEENDYRNDYNTLVHNNTNSDIPISVCIRKRPLNKKELAKHEIDVATVVNTNSVLIHECRHKVDMTKYLETHKFVFDCSFDDYCDNKFVYQNTARPLLDCVFSGGMATCFAYGQTGSGKTFTMGGSSYFGDGSQKHPEGIYDYVASDIFTFLSKKSNQQLFVCLSFFEIYGNKVFDLLNEKRSLRVLEDGQGQIQMKELTEKTVKEIGEVKSALRSAIKLRSSGTTSANQNSSRSHAILQFNLYTRDTSHRKKHRLHGRISLIDLAGNERGADTTACDKNTRFEGSEINKSLLALKECIRALGRKNAHLPFRGSKLTQVLKDSFVAENAKTCMIATISPGVACCENTLNTLHYADRVKQLSSKTAAAGGNNSSSNSNNQMQGEGVVAERKRATETASNVKRTASSMAQMAIKPTAITKYERAQSDMVKQLETEHRYTIQENVKIMEREKQLLQALGAVTLEEYVDQLMLLMDEKITLYEGLDERIAFAQELLKKIEHGRELD